MPFYLRAGSSNVVMFIWPVLLMAFSLAINNNEVKQILTRATEAPLPLLSV